MTIFKQNLTQKLPMSGESMEEVNTELDKLDSVLEVFIITVINIIIIIILLITMISIISIILIITFRRSLSTCTRPRNLQSAAMSLSSSTPLLGINIMFIMIIVIMMIILLMIGVERNRKAKILVCSETY